MATNEELLTDEKIQAFWQEAWLEQNTSVEADPEELEALKSFLAKVRPIMEKQIREEEEAEKVGWLIQRGWLPPDQAKMEIKGAKKQERKRIESYLVTTIQPDGTKMHHIDDAEWQALNED